MLKRYRMRTGYGGFYIYAQNSDDREEKIDGSEHEWVRYEDAEALQMRVIELEQKLKTQDELKAEFEKECE